MESSLDIARAYGLPVREKGSRSWTCCPLHEEKTASLCFFPDGRWYCFGCHRHGDAADLYAALYGVSLREALRIVNGEQERTEAPCRPKGNELRHRVQAWKSARWAEACRAKHAAEATMALLESTHTGALLMELDAYWMLVQQLAAAEDTLNLLESATPTQLVHMISEENREQL